MRYGWEFKLECVTKYKLGTYIPVPDKSNANHHDFMHMVRDWVKIYDLHGIDSEENKMDASCIIQENIHL